MTERILSWESVQPEHMTYGFTEQQCDYIVYKVERLPDFSEVRFSYLSQDADQRQPEVMRKQLVMVRQFYGLGKNWGISLRLIKRDKKIILYLIFRHSGSLPLSNAELQSARQQINNSLMNREYQFIEVEDPFGDPYILSADWSDEVAEIVKAEEEYSGAIYPDGTCMTYYSPVSFIPGNSDMESICNALIGHPDDAAVDVTIIPTSYLQDEKRWVNTSMLRLRESMNGETIKNAKGKILWTGEKLPILKTPLDNFEKMNKQYENSQLFLSSIRVFSVGKSASLAQTLMASSIRNNARVMLFRKGFEKFNYYMDCYRSIDVSADAVTPYWIKNKETAPFRAQRFVRLSSLEEISSFFRTPVPIRPGFPGFGFDNGFTRSNTEKGKETLTIGNYIDEPGKQETEAELSLQQFAKHGLIVGVPGSGKTTAMFHILYQLWNRRKEERIPFIVLEPAKTEYRALKKLELFKDDMLVFTLGDEGVSPFRFNPMEVLPGIKIESHISKLQACFVGAFDMFDPLPIFLEQAIRKTYLEKGWYEDSRGGDPGLETPTLSDLCRNAEYIVANSGFDDRLRSDFQSSLLERLNSLRRGSKGRMLDTKNSIPMEDLMNRPIVLELDSLNGDEKSLLMMFLLSYVYEYCKVQRRSGSSLKHMLIVEEAHNLIPSQFNGSDQRANPKEKTIELFVNMLAEMRALGQGILIADQLPTAIAPQAVKQTNVKLLMRITAKDDREEIGNTMDLNEEQMHQVVNFKTGDAYLYHEGEDRVRGIKLPNFKGIQHLEEPPTEEELSLLMSEYEKTHSSFYHPFPKCEEVCDVCDRRVRYQAESFVKEKLLKIDVEKEMRELGPSIGFCMLALSETKKEAERIENRYGMIGKHFTQCVWNHIIFSAEKQKQLCTKKCTSCKCSAEKHKEYAVRFMKLQKG